MGELHENMSGSHLTTKIKNVEILKNIKILNDIILYFVLQKILSIFFSIFDIFVMTQAHLFIYFYLTLHACIRCINNLC